MGTTRLLLLMIVMSPIWTGHVYLPSAKLSPLSLPTSAQISYDTPLHQVLHSSRMLKASLSVIMCSNKYVLHRAKLSSLARKLLFIYFSIEVSLIML